DASAPGRVAMSGGVVTCFDEEDVRAAALTMARQSVRRVLVVDRDQQPVGILSVDDLALRGCDPDIVASIFARVARRDLELEGDRAAR
ncbi:MAG: CBS domain-containing protein, partial [Polyangia bacterium]